MGRSGGAEQSGLAGRIWESSEPRSIIATARTWIGDPTQTVSGGPATDERTGRRRAASPVRREGTEPIPTIRDDPQGCGSSLWILLAGFSRDASSEARRPCVRHPR